MLTPKDDAYSDPRARDAGALVSGVVAFEATHGVANLNVEQPANVWLIALTFPGDTHLPMSPCPRTTPRTRRSSTRRPPESVTPAVQSLAAMLELQSQSGRA